MPKQLITICALQPIANISLKKEFIKHARLT